MTRAGGTVYDGGQSAQEDPLTGQSKTFRMVGKTIDPNKHVFSMYEDLKGKEALAMEITYTRQ